MVLATTWTGQGQWGVKNGCERNNGGTTHGRVVVFWAIKAGREEGETGDLASGCYYSLFPRKTWAILGCQGNDQTAYSSQPAPQASQKALLRHLVEDISTSLCLGESHPRSDESWTLELCGTLLLLTGPRLPVSDYVMLPGSGYSSMTQARDFHHFLCWRSRFLVTVLLYCSQWLYHRSPLKNYSPQALIAA